MIGYNYCAHDQETSRLQYELITARDFFDPVFLDFEKVMRGAYSVKAEEPPLLEGPYRASCALLNAYLEYMLDEITARRVNTVEIQQDILRFDRMVGNSINIKNQSSGFPNLQKVIRALLFMRIGDHQLSVFKHSKETTVENLSTANNLIYGICAYCFALDHLLDRHLYLRKIQIDLSKNQPMEILLIAECFLTISRTYSSISGIDGCVQEVMCDEDLPFYLLYPNESRARTEAAKFFDSKRKRTAEMRSRITPGYETLPDVELLPVDEEQSFVIVDVLRRTPGNIWALPNLNMTNIYAAITPLVASRPTLLRRLIWLLRNETHTYLDKMLFEQTHLSVIPDRKYDMELEPTVDETNLTRADVKNFFLMMRNKQLLIEPKHLCNNKKDYGDYGRTEEMLKKKNAGICYPWLFYLDALASEKATWKGILLRCYGQKLTDKMEREAFEETLRDEVRKNFPQRPKLTVAFRKDEELVQVKTITPSPEDSEKTVKEPAVTHFTKLVEIKKIVQTTEQGTQVEQQAEQETTVRLQKELEASTSSTLDKTTEANKHVELDRPAEVHESKQENVVPLVGVYHSLNRVYALNNVATRLKSRSLTAAQLSALFDSLPARQEEIKTQTLSLTSSVGNVPTAANVSMAMPSTSDVSNIMSFTIQMIVEERPRKKPIKCCLQILSHETNFKFILDRDSSKYQMSSEESSCQIISNLTLRFVNFKSEDLATGNLTQTPPIFVTFENLKKRDELLNCLQRVGISIQDEY